MCPVPWPVSVHVRYHVMCLCILFLLIFHPFYDCFILNATTQNHKHCVSIGLWDNRDTRQMTPRISFFVEGILVFLGFVKTRPVLYLVIHSSCVCVCLCVLRLQAVGINHASCVHTCRWRIGFVVFFFIEGSHHTAVVMETVLVWIQP